MRVAGRIWKRLFHGPGGVAAAGTAESGPGSSDSSGSGGSGRSGAWSRAGQVSRAGGMSCVVCLIRPEKLDPLLEAAFKVVERHIGVVSVTDCDVLRAERF